MNKAELVKSIVVGADVTRLQAERMLNTLQETVLNALQHGEKVALRSFGTFTISDRVARRYHHPQTHEYKIAKACRTVRFVPSAEIKSQLN